MQTASFTGLVRTLLIMIGIYYAFKIIARILMPIILRKMVQKAEQNFKQQTQNQPQQTASNFDKPKVKKEVGEYIDYEEVE